MKGSNGLLDPSQVLIYLPSHLSLETMPPSCKSSQVQLLKHQNFLCHLIMLLCFLFIVISNSFTIYIFWMGLFFKFLNFFRPKNSLFRLSKKKKKKLLVSIQNRAFTLSTTWFWLCWVSTTRLLFKFFFCFFLLLCYSRISRMLQSTLWNSQYTIPRGGQNFFW